MWETLTQLQHVIGLNLMPCCEWPSHGAEHGLDGTM